MNFCSTRAVIQCSDAPPTVAMATSNASLMTMPTVETVIRFECEDGGRFLRDNSTEARSECVMPGVWSTVESSCYSESRLGFVFYNHFLSQQLVTLPLLASERLFCLCVAIYLILLLIRYTLYRASNFFFFLSFFFFFS